MYSAYKLNNQGDNIQLWRTPFPIWNQSVVPCPVLTVASWPEYRFLRRQVRWSGISICLRIFQFAVIHTVESFNVVNETEADVFLEFSCFTYDPMDWAIWSLVPLPFLNLAWTSASSRFTYCWSLAWGISSITLLACVLCQVLSCCHVRPFATPWTVAWQAPLSMGILQVQILDWIATSFSRGSSQPRDQTQVPHIAGGFFTVSATREAIMWDECNCAVIWTFSGIFFLWYWKKNWPFPLLWPLLIFPD